MSKVSSYWSVFVSAHTLPLRITYSLDLEKSKSSPTTGCPLFPSTVVGPFRHKKTHRNSPQMSPKGFLHSGISYSLSPLSPCLPLLSSPLLVLVIIRFPGRVTGL